MSQFPFNWMKELEQVGKAVQTSKTWEEFFGNVHRMVAGEPRVTVDDLRHQLRVMVEAPGLSNKQKHEWSFRVEDQTLLLKGALNHEEWVENNKGSFYSERRSEQFSKGVMLPARVKSKPFSAEYHNGQVQLLFDKLDQGQDADWYPIRWSKK